MTEYICEYCSKKYIRKKPFTHHKLICELSYKNSKRQEKYYREIEETTVSNIPSQRELYEIIITLNNKYDKLQTDYDMLKRYVYDKKRKIQIIDWLNQNCSLEIGFDELFLNIKLSQEDLNIVFEKDYINGIVEIILKFIDDKKNLLKNGEIPLKAFVQKEGILYIYSLVDNHSRGVDGVDGVDGVEGVEGVEGVDGVDCSKYSWKIMSSEVIDKFIKVISVQLLVLFKNWHLINEKIMDNDKFNELYIKNLKCVMGGKFNNCEKNIKIKNYLYRNIRQNFKNILVYEF